MELLERETALARLGQWRVEAASGSGRLVFLAGEAGVGKTALLRQIATATADPVLWGACDPLSLPRPLGPLLDIAPAVGGELERALRTDAKRDRVFHALWQVLEHADTPQTLVLEDVHWADEATLDLLRFLGRRLRAAPVLLIASYRDDEVGPGHPLALAMGDLATSDCVRRVTLSPLTENAVRALVAAQQSDIDAAELHRVTGGNPFFVTEILDAGGHGLPATVRDAVLARAARLTTDARPALDAVAVLGPRNDAALVAAQAGQEAAQALDACIQAGVLRTEGNALAFRHELARAAILDAMPPIAHRAAHARALAARIARGATPDDWADLAHHAEAAGDAAAVLEHAPAAARRAAALRSHRESAAQYERALRFAAALPPATRAQLLEARAYECYLTNAIPAALAAREQALAIWRDLGNQVKTGENLRWMSRLAWFAGQRERAHTDAEAAFAALAPAGDPLQLAWAETNMAQIQMLDGEYAAAIEWGERALVHADTEIQAHALNNIGTARLLLDADPRGWSELERAFEIARTAGMEEHVARACTNLASAAVQLRDHERADRWLDIGIGYCAEHDLDAWRLYMLGWRAQFHLHRGRFDAAVQDAAVVLRHPNVSAISVVHPLVVVGLVRARRGDPDAWAPLGEAAHHANATGELQRIGPTQAARAEAAWLAGEPERTLHEAHDAFTLALTKRDAWLAGELGAWCRRAGAAVEIPDWVARPYQAQATGDWRGAAALWRELGCPYDEALALADSDDDAGLQEALARFESLHARPAAVWIARRLRERGARGVARGPRASTRAHPAGLTAREVEVLRLVAQGLRDHEIAARLFVAPKTVGHHVSSILQRLGVRTRTEAATVFARWERDGERA